MHAVSTQTTQNTAQTQLVEAAGIEVAAEVNTFLAR